MDKEFKMNEWQALALRRKKILLTSMFDFSEPSQEEYVECGLLTKDMIPEIMVSTLYPSIVRTVLL